VTCIFYFWLMHALVFYFVIRSHRNPILVWIQIDLKFIKDLEKKRRFSIFPSLMGQNSTSLPAWPSQPALQVDQQLAAQPISRPSRGPAAVVRSGHRVRTRSTNPLARIWLNKRASDPLGFKPDPNPSSYPLSYSFKLSLSPSQFLLIRYDSKPSWRYIS
jgi:hypothetical protein